MATRELLCACQEVAIDDPLPVIPPATDNICVRDCTGVTPACVYKSGRAQVAWHFKAATTVRSPATHATRLRHHTSVCATRRRLQHSGQVIGVVGLALTIVTPTPQCARCVPSYCFLDDARVSVPRADLQGLLQIAWDSCCTEWGIAWPTPYITRLHITNGTRM